MSCAFIGVGGGSVAIQTDNPHGVNSYVSLVPLGTQLDNSTTALLQSQHHPGQLIIQTNENNQSSFTYSTSEPSQAVEDQQQTLLLVTTNPDEISGPFTLNQNLLKNSQNVQIPQQIVLVTDLQGTSQGAIIQMPSTASVIQVPGVITNGDQAVTYIGANQSSPVAIDSSNTVFVANPGVGDIILCLQPGEVTTLQVPSTLVVDGSDVCFGSTTIEPQIDDVNQADLARSWQVDSDLVSRAMNALSSHTSVQDSTINLVNSTNSSSDPLLCSRVSSEN